MSKDFDSRFEVPACFMNVNIHSSKELRELQRRTNAIQEILVLATSISTSKIKSSLGLRTTPHRGTRFTTQSPCHGGQSLLTSKSCDMYEISIDIEFRGHKQMFRIRRTEMIVSVDRTSFPRVVLLLRGHDNTESLVLSTWIVQDTRICL